MKNRLSQILMMASLPVVALFTMGSECEDDVQPGDLGEYPENVEAWWDPDGDGISTLTELNSANAYLDLDPEVYNPDPTWARGLPCKNCTPGQLECGYIDDALNLRNVGFGYIHYVGTDTIIDTDDWGTLALINMIEGAGRDWYLDNYVPPNINVGDLSKGNLVSRTFGGYWPPHGCHQNGLEADFRFVRNDSQDIPLDLSDTAQLRFYDPNATWDLINTYLCEYGDITVIYLDTLLSGITGQEVIHDTNHYNHFHVRIADPDGSNNKERTK